MKKTYLKSLLIVCLSASLAACAAKEAKTQSQEVETVKKVVVRTEKSTTGSVADIAEFTGNIQPFQQNNIAASMPLRIEKIYVEVGDQVKKGDLLVSMDKNQYIQSSVQLENYKADLERMKSVYEAGGISKQSLDQMMVQVKVMQEANQNLKQNIELRSPINGVITSRSYDAGDMFSGAGSILTVMQIDKLKVMVDISERNFPDVYTNMPVKLYVDVYPDREFDGKVNLVYPSITATTHTFTTELTFDNKDSKLRPGMFARAVFNFSESDGVLVNDLAVQKQQGSNERYVYVVVDGKADRRVVKLGRKIGSQYHIISGVEPGEEVVISGMSRLIKGIEVEVVNK